MRKKILLVMLGLLMCFGLTGFAMSCFSRPTNETNAYTKQAVIEWDTDRKLIYANQNSIIINGENSGTTVYIDFAAGQDINSYTSSGDGILQAGDLSLMSLYNLDPTKHKTMPPADGADLSEWSIVFGSPNMDMEKVSNLKMVATMLGGTIKNIYSGHSCLDVEYINRMLGKVEFNMMGGSVNTIYTDEGYIEQNYCIADGTSSAVFNLSGGSVQAIKRINEISNGKLTYFGKVNVQGSVVVSCVDRDFFKSRTDVTVVGELVSGAQIIIDLENEIDRNDSILKVANADVLNALDLSKIQVINRPNNASLWNLYKNQNAVRFGYDQKVDSVELVGFAKVGETLTVSVAPAESNVENVVWFRKDTSIDKEYIIGYGSTYTVKDVDGGKYIYFRAIDKNDSSQHFTFMTEDVIERIETPEIEINMGIKTLYLNGYNVLVDGEADKTTIYLDFGEIGVLDSKDKSLATVGIENAPADSSDLSNFVISAGCSVNKNIGEVTITVLGGNIGKIENFSKNGYALDGYVLVEVFGGNIGLVEIPKASADDSIIRLKDDVCVALYSQKHSFASEEVEVVGVLGENSKISFIVSENSQIGDVLLSSEIENAFKSVRFEVVDNKGKISTKFTATISGSNVVLSKFVKNGSAASGLDEGLTAFQIVLISLGSAIVLSGVVLIVWYVLWTKKIVSAGFMKKIFTKMKRK